MKRIAIFLLTLTLLSCPAVFADQSGVEILYPSTMEETIAPGRDFYVIGTYDQTLGIQKITVELLDKDGKTVRTVSSGNADFNTAHESLNAFHTESNAFLMPDLVFNADKPESSSDASIKCYFKDGYYFALILGGNFQSDIVLPEGEESLSAGKYTLCVSAEDSNKTVKKAEKEILLAVTPDKVLSRFSPDNHLKKVTDFANEAGYRLYLDPMPGYWSPSSFIKGQEENPYFSEFLDRWQTADAQEYQEGNVHFFIYNIKPTSTSQAVEMAAIQKTNGVNTRLNNYCYDIGEPFISYTGFDAKAKELNGNIVGLEEGDTLRFNRAELTLEPERDNYYIVHDPAVKEIDVDTFLISVEPKRHLTLFGTVTPIQNDADDIQPVSGAQYTVGNLVSKVQYDILCGEEVVDSFQKEIALTREWAQDWTDPSLYEFAHVISIPEGYDGKTLCVQATAYDSKGNLVAGGTEVLYVTLDDASNDFTDIAYDAWYKDAVSYLKAAGVIVGKEDNRFDPDAPLTRAEFVTMLAVSADADITAFDKPSAFSDVEDEWYRPYVNWAYENNVVIGTGGDIFLPDAPVTKAQVAAMTGMDAGEDTVITRAEAANSLALSILQ